MSQMFSDARQFNGNISTWNVEKVRNGAEHHPVSDNGTLKPHTYYWCHCQVQDMSSMFHDANNFNGDISGWNVSNVSKER